MNLKDYIIEEQIVFSDALMDQKDVFELIAQVAIQNGITASAECIITQLKNREMLGSTGLLDGFAIPHAQDETINKAMIVIIISKNEISWETLDNSNVKIIFGLLIPSKDKGDIHIEFLSQISTLLMDKEFRDTIKQSHVSSEIIKIIEKFT